MQLPHVRIITLEAETDAIRRALEWTESSGKCRTAHRALSAIAQYAHARNEVQRHAAAETNERLENGDTAQISGSQRQAPHPGGNLRLSGAREPDHKDGEGSADASGDQATKFLTM
jgi:hypothetical protein